MTKKLLSLAMAAAITGAMAIQVNTANAQAAERETWAEITAVGATMDGDSTIDGATWGQSFVFGPFSELRTDGGRPSSADDNYIRFSAADDIYYNQTLGSAVETLTDGTLSVAFAFRIETGHGGSTETFDWFLFGGGAPAAEGSYFGTFITEDGEIAIGPGGNFSLPFSERIIIPDVNDVSGLDLEDGSWYVLAFRFTPSETDGSLKTWVIAFDGTTVALPELTGFTNTRVGRATTFNLPNWVDGPTNSNIVVDMDDYGFYANTLSDTDFVDAILAEYDITSNVSDWLAF